MDALFQCDTVIEDDLAQLIVENTDEQKKDKLRKRIAIKNFIIIRPLLNKIENSILSWNITIGPISEKIADNAKQ